MRLELYGRLKDAGLGEDLEIEVPGPGRPTARGVLEALSARLGPKAPILAGSVLATSSEVLRPDDPVPAGRRLAVLPPVCGG